MYVCTFLCTINFSNKKQTIDKEDLLFLFVPDKNCIGSDIHRTHLFPSLPLLLRVFVRYRKRNRYDHKVENERLVHFRSKFCKLISRFAKWVEMLDHQKNCPHTLLHRDIHRLHRNRDIFRLFSHS